MKCSRPWIGKRINTLREIRGETLQQVAESVGTSKSLIYQIETDPTHDALVEKTAGVVDAALRKP